MSAFLRSWGAPLALICLAVAATSYPEIDAYCSAVFLIVLGAALFPAFQGEAPKEE